MRSGHHLIPRCPDRGLTVYSTVRTCHKKLKTQTPSGRHDSQEVEFGARAQVAGLNGYKYTVQWNPSPLYIVATIPVIMGTRAETCNHHEFHYNHSPPVLVRGQNCSQFLSLRIADESLSEPHTRELGGEISVILYVCLYVCLYPLDFACELEAKCSRGMSE